MVIGLLIFFSTLIAKLLFDVHLYYEGKPNKHLAGPALVLVALVLCSWAAGWLSAPMWFSGYWIVFNGCYAVLIGQRWDYLGATAKLDIFEHNNKWVTPVKYGIFFISTILYLWLK